MSMVPTSATAGKASSWQKMDIPVKVRSGCLTSSGVHVYSLEQEELPDPLQPLMLQVIPEDGCALQLPQRLQKVTLLLHSAVQ